MAALCALRPSAEAVLSGADWAQGTLVLSPDQPTGTESWGPGGLFLAPHRQTGWAVSRRKTT